MSKYDGWSETDRAGKAQGAFLALCSHMGWPYDYVPRNAGVSGIYVLPLDEHRPTGIYDFSMLCYNAASRERLVVAQAIDDIRLKLSGEFPKYADLLGVFTNREGFARLRWPNDLTDAVELFLEDRKLVTPAVAGHSVVLAKPSASDPPFVPFRQINAQRTYRQARLDSARELDRKADALVREMALGRDSDLSATGKLRWITRELRELSAAWKAEE